ncbi:MAG: restriction endonuclease subunit S [Myxococcota bacterium]
MEDILDRRGVTPLKLGSEFVRAGHRVISAKLIKNRGIDLAADEPRFVDGPTYKKWMRTPLLPDDVILTSEAPLGELAYIKSRLEWCIGQRLFAVRTNKQRLHGRFLYYALQSENVVQELHSRATGTTVLGIRQTELRRVQIPLPSMAAQRAIAQILGTLDDKIELNRRTSETLEAMARALFKSWFVDFDPVHSKAEGREPAGMDAATAALFPGSFEQSVLAPIPQGWRPCLSTSWRRTSTERPTLHSRAESRPSRLPIIKIAELKSGVTSQTGFSHIQMPEKYRIEQGDILFSWSGNPDTSIDTFVWSHGPGWLNQHLRFFRIGIRTGIRAVDTHFSSLYSRNLPATNRPRALGM